jgi:crotonobetainyl-CoA hydratase
MKRAMEIIMTARRLSAQEAFDLGIVNKVVPAGGALDAAIAMAEEILTAAPLAIRASKAVVRRALQQDVQNAMLAHLDYPQIVAMMGSEDAKEGPRAFAEKRAPNWSGR